IFAGEGSPLTQGLAMGLGGPVSAADLDAVEAQLRPRPNRREAPGRGSVEPWRDRPHGHGARQMELTPFAHPSLAAELARRGYRVHEWQLVWTRGVPDAPLAAPPPELRLAPMATGQEELFLRVIMAGFLESEEVPEAALALMRPLAFAQQHERWLCWLGDEPIGG